MAQSYFNPNEIMFWEAMLGIDEIDREERFADHEENIFTFDHSMAQLVSFSTKPSQVRHPPFPLLSYLTLPQNVTIFICVHYDCNPLYSFR